MISPKTCKRCKGTYKKPPQTSIRRWGARLYCSKSCAGRSLVVGVGSAHPLWRGGITTNSEGYYVFTNSTANGDNAGCYVHRVNFQKHIGRCLTSAEHIHHIDGDKKNNDISNLMIMSHSDHARHHAIKNELGKRNA